MNQAQEIQQKYRAFRQSLYQDYPEVERFEKKKRKWLLFLLVYSLVISVTKALAIWQMTRPPVIVLILGSIIGVGMNLIFLASSMGTKWKLAFILYFWFFYNLFNVISTFVRQGVTSLETFMWAYVNGFFQYPLAVTNDVLSWFFILLLLPTAMWLTLVPANRKMAEQSDELYSQMKQFIADNPIK